MATGTDFSGFSADTLGFLRELQDHNNKTWFDANRGRYEDALLGPAKAFVMAMEPGMRTLDEELVIEPKVNGSIFRINRDVRFSKDKRPYKEELAFRFRARGPKDAAPSFLMRITPEIIGLGVGLWTFPKGMLERFREGVADETRGAALAGMIEGLKVNGCSFMAPSLKRVPRPYESDHPRGELLKLKGLTIGVDRPIAPVFESADLVPWCVGEFARLAPIFLWLKQTSSDAGAPLS
jgi:uncharacterized protein (TIGR02453 family)